MIQGEDISRMDDRRLTLFRRDRVGIIFQFFNLLPILNLEENIALPYLLREGSNPPAAKMERLLQEVGLRERRYHHPHELSGGEMQRVAICRALINDPEIILADEPWESRLLGKAGPEILRRLWTPRRPYPTTHSQEGAAMVIGPRMRDGDLVE
jgi:ABC-type lipoprotein export system ATPase subunit